MIRRQSSALFVATALAFQACGGAVSSKQSEGGANAAGDKGDAAVGATSGNNTPGNGPNPSLGGPVEVVEDVKTALPKLPALVNVRGTVDPDSAQIEFDPVDGAVDYRIYELPSDADISVTGDAVAIKNATYRCAGNKETPEINSDDGLTKPNNENVARSKVTSDVGGYTRTLPEANLGYVYVTPGKGRIPVWALGDPDAAADMIYDTLYGGWDASRIKTYTSSPEERDRLLAKGWRDEGVQFYVPKDPGASGQALYTASTKSPENAKFYAVFYWTGAAESAVRQDRKAADFKILKTKEAGTQPLMRVHYESFNSAAHDELVVGQSRFMQIYHQGNYPLTTLLWSGFSKPTTLVVEALASGCPYQGMMSAKHIDAATNDSVGSEVNPNAEPVTHEEYVTPSEMRAKSPNAELFINGQYDTDVAPRAIARTFVKVTPAERPKMDFYEGFEKDEVYSAGKPTTPAGNFGYGSYRWSNDKYNFTIYNADVGPLFAAGAMFGQMWITYSDLAQDTNGRFRLEPKQTATLSDKKFVHVTMSIDSVSSRRRYPQIIVSDQKFPVQETMKDGNSVVVQPIGIWPPQFQIQFCDHVMWDVNAQCDFFDMYYRSGSDEGGPRPPVPHVGERSGVDRSNQYDVYVSTSRAYVFFDGIPYGCADLPADRLKPGEVSVTFGDVLYHSAVDVLDASSNFIYLFHTRHLALETRRHFDDLGFSSDVEAPAWDFDRLPCQGTLRPFE